VSLPVDFVRDGVGIDDFIRGVFASCPFSEIRTVGLSAASLLVPLSFSP
jgi:hypothetical protein